MPATPSQTAPNPYLRTKVLTASPEQLRLMLFEGVVKFCRQARHALTNRDLESMYTAIVKAQNIVLELNNTLNHKHDPDLCEKLAALYSYIYRRLVDANMERDVAALDEAISLLDYERETWSMLLDKLQREREGGRDPVAVAKTAALLHEPENPLAVIRPADAEVSAKSSPKGFSAQG